jgi:hypothetical protein
MNKLDTAKRTQIVSAIVEGCSIRSIVRMTGASKNTISKLMVELGAACSDYMDKNLRNLKSERIQCDEIWSFVAAKERNVTPAMRDKNPALAIAGPGSAWTLIPSWFAPGRLDGAIGPLPISSLLTFAAGWRTESN